MYSESNRKVLDRVKHTQHESFEDRPIASRAYCLSWSGRPGAAATIVPSSPLPAFSTPCSYLPSADGDQSSRSLARAHTIPGSVTTSSACSLGRKYIEDDVRVNDQDSYIGHSSRSRHPRGSRLQAIRNLISNMDPRPPHDTEPLGILAG